jgi:hypothetical protein
MRGRRRPRGDGQVGLAAGRRDPDVIVSSDLPEPSAWSVPGAGRFTAGRSRSGRCPASCRSTRRSCAGRSGSRRPPRGGGTGCGATCCSSSGPPCGRPSARQASRSSIGECCASARAGPCGRTSPAITRIGDHSVRAVLAWDARDTRASLHPGGCSVRHPE